MAASAIITADGPPFFVKYYGYFPCARLSFIPRKDAERIKHFADLLFERLKKAEERALILAREVDELREAQKAGAP